MKYEGLVIEAEADGIMVLEHRFKSNRIKGLCINKTLTINSSIETSSEKACILGEEMGHCYTSSGNILNLKCLSHKKQEKRARNWAYDKLIPLDKLIEAFDEGIRTKYELAEFLCVTETFLEDAIKHFKEKYGTMHVRNGAIIYFDPLGVYKSI